MENQITYKKRVQDHLDNAFQELKNIHNVLNTSGDTWKMMVHIDNVRKELIRMEEVVRIVSRRAFDEIFVE